MAMSASANELTTFAADESAVDDPLPRGSGGGRNPTVWSPSDLLFVVPILAGPWLLAGDTGRYTTAVTVGCYALVVLSLQWVVGYAGMLVLGHPALFGTGAYVSAILTTRYDWPFAAAAAAAVVAVVALAAVLAPTLRLHGVYLALGTLAFVFIFGEAVLFWSSYTGGAAGLVGIPSLPFTEPSGLRRHVPYAVVWTLVVVVVVLSRRFKATRAGRSLFALNEDEDVAISVGIHAARARLHIWLASAALSGLAGTLYAHHIRYLSVGQFDVAASVELIAMLIVGGIVSPIGAVLGVVLFVMMPEMFEPVGEYRVFLFGTSLLVIVALAPGGLVTVPDRIRAAIASIRTREGSRG